MIILLFGSSGLLGSSILNLFSCQPNLTVVNPSRTEVDLTSSILDLQRYIDSVSPDIIINCAGKIGGLYSQIKLPADYLAVNVSILNNLFQATCASTKRPHIINFLSTCCFPVDVTYPITPEQLHAGPPHSTNSSYSFAKRLVDTYSSAFYNQHSLLSSTFILGNLFGQHDHFSSPETAHVIPSLIMKSFRAVEDQSYVLPIQGNGAPLREFLYANDVASMLLSYIVSPLINTYSTPYLFSNHNEISILDLASKIANLVSPDHPIRVQPQSLSDIGQLQKPSCSSPELIALDIPFTPLETALSDVITHYRHYHLRLN